MPKPENPRNYAAMTVQDVAELLNLTDRQSATSSRTRVYRQRRTRAGTCLIGTPSWTGLLTTKPAKNPEIAEICALEVSRRSRRKR